MAQPIRASGISANDNLLTEAADLFGLSRLGERMGFESLLIRSNEPAGRLLRLTHSSRRSEEMVLAEFEFMDHLSNSGVPVAAPIRSVDGNLVEHVEDTGGEVVVVSCVTVAKGGHRPRTEWSDTDLVSYGRLLGSMHAAAASFCPEGARRPNWSDPSFDPGIAAASTDPEIYQRHLEVRRAAQAIEAGSPEFVIHQDAHLGNIFITDDGKLTIFDFDDCAYGTASHDLGIVLFYWLFGREGDQGEEARRFVSLFSTGYEEFTALPSDWPTRADRFLSLRELDLFWIIQTEGPHDLSPAESRFMRDRRLRILSGVPFLGSGLETIL